MPYHVTVCTSPLVNRCVTKLSSVLPGFTFHQLRIAETTRLRRVAARLKPRPEAAQSRAYVPKFHWTQMPDMLSTEFPSSGWKDWEPDKCPLNLKMDSWVDTDALLDLAKKHQFPHMGWVAKWVNTLKLT